MRMEIDDKQAELAVYGRVDALGQFASESRE